jgi:hypothetical protein
LPNPSDFGIYSIYLVIIGFGVPLSILGLYDPMYKEYFDKNTLIKRYNIGYSAWNKKISNVAHDLNKILNNKNKIKILSNNSRNLGKKYFAKEKLLDDIYEVIHNNLTFEKSVKINHIIPKVFKTL